MNFRCLIGLLSFLFVWLIWFDLGPCQRVSGCLNKEKVWTLFRSHCWLQTEPERESESVAYKSIFSSLFQSHSVQSHISKGKDFNLSVTTIVLNGIPFISVHSFPAMDFCEALCELVYWSVTQIKLWFKLLSFLITVTFKLKLISLLHQVTKQQNPMGSFFSHNQIQYMLLVISSSIGIWLKNSYSYEIRLGIVVLAVMLKGSGCRM